MSNRDAYEVDFVLDDEIQYLDDLVSYEAEFI